MPRAGRPRTAARAKSSSTWEAPRRKEKFVVVWSSVYTRFFTALRGCSFVGGMLRPFVRWRGSMNREGNEARQDREEDRGIMDREAVANRVIGLAIKVHRALG